MIKDKNISWNVKRVFISVQEMAGFAADQITSLGAGTPLFQEMVAAAQLSGLAMAAAGDEIFHFWKIPWDLNRDQPIQIRILFCHITTDTDNPDWLASMKGISIQQALTAANSSADVTFTFPALAVAVIANALEKTSWQSSGDNSGLADADLFAQLAIECNGLGGAGANEISIIGIELAYTIKATKDSPGRDTTSIALPELY